LTHHPIDPLLLVLLALLILRGALSLLRKTSQTLLAGRIPGPKRDEIA